METLDSLHKALDQTGVLHRGVYVCMCVCVYVCVCVCVCGVYRGVRQSECVYVCVF